MYGYKKYASNGDLIKSRDDDSCNWKSKTSSSPSNTSEESIISEMKLMENNTPYKSSTKTPYSKKKSIFDRLNDEYDQEINKSDVRSYFNKVPPPMTGAEKDYSNKCWTEFFTVCGVKFALLQHPLFIKACKSLRPSYDPVCPKTAKLSYVKKLVNECNDEIKNVMNDKKIWVQCDGSENGQKEGVIHIIGSGTFGTRLINIIYHKPGAKVGADQIISDLENTRLSLLNGLGIVVHFGGYLHDNENTEKAVGRKFVEKYKRGHAGCGPHGYNKTMDYIFQFADFLIIYTNTNMIVRYFSVGKIRSICDEYITKKRIRKSLLLSDKTRDICSDLEILDSMVNDKFEKNNKVVGHPKAGETRKWTNQFYIISWCIDNKTELLKTIKSSKAKDIIKKRPDIISLLNDEDFWDKTLELNVKLAPLFTESKMAQSDDRN